MVHNGIISMTSSAAKDGESDTSLYAKVLSNRYVNPWDALHDEFEIKRITNEIGWSKLVFLDGNDNHRIVNEKSGDWVDGCWFSNSSHKNSYRRWSSYFQSGSKTSWMYGDDDAWEGYGTNRSSTPATTPSTYHYSNRQAVLGEPKPVLASLPESPEEAEWQALLARYEAKYGRL
jgi:hypothetical protein